MNPQGVLVVGDGPAGCAAAIAAAKTGCDVLMLGRGGLHDAPECVSGAALKLLESLAPSLATQAMLWLDASADTRGGRAIVRSSFDAALRAEAQATGVHYSRAPAGKLLPRVEQGRITGVTWADGDCGERIVIDATGVNGWLRRALALEELTDSSLLWLRRGYAGANSPHHGTYWQITRSGWLWVKATSKGPIWTSLSTTRQANVSWPAGISPVGRVWHECRRWRQLRAAAGPGYFVCGDAAGYLDPATGDGVRFAIESGLRAGALAAGITRHPDRASVSAALYADWVSQSYLAARTVLAESYARAALDIEWDREVTLPRISRL